MNLGIQGRTAIVAAASQGLGKAAALRLVQEGANVVICARDRKRILAAGKEIGRWVKGKKQVVMPLVADVRKSKDIERVVGSASREFGRVDILVTNAGGPPPGTFADVTDDGWQEGMTLTFLSVVRFVRAVLPHMEKRRWGRIVNITSLTVRQPVGDLTVSSAFRPAVVGLARVLAARYAGSGITVNNVAPGYIRTSRQEEITLVRARQKGVTVEEYLRELVREVPAGRLGEPEEVGDLIAFLASDRAAYITGATIGIDGGVVKGMM